MTDYSGKRVLVTGAEGFIGSHLTTDLVRRGARVTALSQYNSFGTLGWLDDLPDDIFRELKIVSGDVRDPHFVRQLTEELDVVFHLAALIAIPYSYVAPQSYVDVNVTGTLNILEACRSGSVGRMIHTSTSEVYGTALFTPITEQHPLQGQSPYSASKIAADHMVEAYCRSFEVPAVILRPFNTFGPRQSERAVIPTVIRQMLDPACDDVRIGDLAPVRDFNYVEDIADAFCRIGLADSPEFGRAYNAGSGRAVTIGEMIDIVRGIVGSNKAIVEESHRRRPSKSEVFELIAAAARIEEACSWKSSVGLEAGLARTVEWWRARLAAGQVRRDAGYQV
ncbi:SDR family NAD(P)-dependent oxidoreductase [Rhodospirillaceae bacterium KN72]|uniref:SDR family NAD(P)-dependent oxidoreductase n=1 Tax=Pacificispira spongiicola TaxID=2729598 RepID=A0A7Y0HFA0_9PROT|nr:SDR family NAD(P)-dependent oxidoreductase [Pacificispira spongiicola]NMM45605.1 SDR family NAD(P)-dependent oxidoreductase [Pacificispira spongiicola]